MSLDQDENNSSQSSAIEVPTDGNSILYNELNRLETFSDLSEYWRVKHLLSLDGANEEDAQPPDDGEY